MVVRLESLRVTADMDVGNYVRAAQQKNAADAQMVQSVKAVGQALAAADAATAKLVPGMASLSRTLITGYNEAAKFESQVRSIGRALDKGMDAGRATIQLDGLYRKFGQVADASALAGAGFVKLAPLVSALNAEYAENARRAALAADAQTTLAARMEASRAASARAQTFQGALNARLGVSDTFSGAAASGEVFEAKYQKLAQDAQRYLSALDPLSAAEARHNANLAEGNRLLKEGEITSRQFATASANSAKELEKVKQAVNGLSKEETAMLATRDRLLRSYDIIGTAQRTHDQNVQEATKLLQSGRLQQHEYNTIVTQSSRVLNDTKQAFEGAFTAQNKFGNGTGLARHELVNFGRQAQDVFVSLASGQGVMTVLIQQGTQIADIFATSRGSLGGFLTQAASGIGRFAVSLAGLATGLVAFGAGAIAAGYQYANGQREIERAMAGVGRQSGITIGQINRMSTAYADAAKVSNATAREMIAAFGATGVIGAGTIGNTAGLTKDFAAFSNTGAVEAAKTLAEAFIDPTKGAQELNKQIGFLDAKTLEYIRTAQAQGRTGEAQRALAEALGQSIAGAADRTNGLARAWNAVWNAASNAWDTLGRAVSGQITLEERLTNLIVARRQAESRRSRFGTAGALAEYDLGIGDVQEQIRRRNQQADRDARTARQRSASTGALSVVDELNPFGAELRRLETMASALRKGLEQAGDAMNPDQARAVAEAYERIQRAIQTALPPAERQRQTNELNVQSINARTVAERTSVEVARLQLDSAFRLKDTEEQRLIVLGKIAEMQAQANREARDALRNAADQAGMAGMRPYQRRMQEIENERRDNRERFGTGASAAQVTAGSPAADGTTALPATTGALRGLDATFAASLRRAMADIPGLTITSGARTYEEQAALYQKYGPGRAARPGTSNHETGRAADLAYNGSGQIPQAIRDRLEREYGIGFPLANRTRGTPEPWHAEPVGGRVRAANTGDAADAIANYRKAQVAAEDYANVIDRANDNIREQEDALKVQARALTATAFETGRAEKSQELYNQLASQGIPVTRELAAAIEETAQRYGRLREAAASVRLTQDVQFERDQLGRTSGEQQIASKLRGTGIGMDSAIADQMRFNQTLTETKSIASDSLKGFINDLRQGKSGMEALRGVLDKLASKLIDMATDQLISGLFKNLLGGSSGGGIFGGLFGGGSGGGLFGGMFGGGSSAAAPLISSGTGGLYANGGVFGGSLIPFARGGAFTNSIVDRPTQFRFANGGAVSNGVMGEAGPEAIMPLRRNSRGQLGVVTAAGGQNQGQAAPQGDAPVVLQIDARGATPDAIAALRQQIPALAVRAVQEARKNRVAGL